MSSEYRAAMSGLHSRDSKLAMLICWLLALATIIAYWPVRHCDFVIFDDPVYVTHNHQVSAGLTWQGVAWALRATVAAEWQPVTLVSHMLDCQLYGLKPAGHHLTNLFFHVANALLLFLVLRRMTGAAWRSAFVAALFALHPLRVESVAWIAERKDVLSTFFFMLTLWAYARYVSESKVQSPKSRVFYGVSLALFALGLMSKPMVVTLPFVLLLLDYWPLGRVSGVRCQVSGEDTRSPNLTLGTTHLAPYIRLLWEKLPFFLLSASGCVIALRAAHGDGILTAGNHLSLSLRLGNALISYCRYMRKMIWPSDLAVLYPHPGTWPLWQVIGAGLFLAVVSILVIGLVQRRPYLLVGWLWFVGMLVPVIGLVQAGMQSSADRFTYVPLIGLFIAITWGVCEAVPDGRWRSSVLGLVAVMAVASCMVVTWFQVGHWKTTETLFRQAVAVTERNYIALEHVGVCAAEKGDLEGAMDFFVRALQINPNSVRAHFNLGSALASKGEWAAAVAHYREALRLDPDYVMVLNNLAWILATHPDPQFRNGAEAVRLAARAVELTQGEDVNALDTMAAAYAEAGQFAQAVKTARRAHELAESAGQTELGGQIRQRLSNYELGKPYRE